MGLKACTARVFVPTSFKSGGGRPGFDAKRSERDRIPELDDGGDTVLKFPSRRAAHEVDGAGLKRDGDDLALGLVRFEAHAAGARREGT